MFLFGLTVTVQGFVQGYGGLLATRFLLGVFEAGVLPGCKSRGRRPSPSISAQACGEQAFT